MTTRTLQLAVAGLCAMLQAIAPNVAFAESVRDNGTSTVGAAGLESLRGKVSGREDLVEIYRGKGLSRFDTESDGTYFFTEPGAAAHAFALYCGRTESGGLEVRGWRAGNEEAAETLKAVLTESIGQAGACTVRPE